jgi:sugar/nucleoside kinase (ribokinase family)
MNIRSRHPSRLVLIGSILIDILMYIDQMPERGGDRIAQRAILTTGGGFNVLSGAEKLGMPVAYAGRVGNGVMGNQVMHDLEHANIPLLLPRVSGADTGFDVGLVESDAERTFVTSPGVEAELSSHDLEVIALKDNDAIYVSGYDLYYAVSGAALEAWLPTLDPEYLLVLDPGPLVAEIARTRLERVMPRVNILSLNARESNILTGSTQAVQAAKQLVPMIARDGWVVARAGELGCWLAHGEQEVIHVAARRTQAIDTTGAGDTHVAALLARLAAGDDMLQAAYKANVAASISTERHGPVTGPTAEELEKALLQS